MEVITRATDWNIADAAKKAGVETNPGRMRVDMDWGLTSPYYNQGNNGMVPAPGGNAGYGQIGSTDPTTIDGSMTDGPQINLANFLGGFAIKEVILRFQAAPFCIEGNDAGKYLGHVVTWEARRTNAAGSTVTVSNIATTAGNPGAEFNQAVANWNAAKSFPLPQPKPVPCP